jgi:hypothetical protein
MIAYAGNDDEIERVAGALVAEDGVFRGESNSCGDD